MPDITELASLLKNINSEVGLKLLENINITVASIIAKDTPTLARSEAVHAARQNLYNFKQSIASDILELAPDVYRGPAPYKADEKWAKAKNHMYRLYADQLPDELLVKWKIMKTIPGSQIYSDTKVSSYNQNT